MNENDYYEWLTDYGNSSYNIFDQFSSIFSGIHDYLIGISIIIALMGLAICFFGYKIQKVYISFITGIEFGIIGYAVINNLSNNSGISLIIAIILAILGFVVGFKFFKAAIVLSIGITGFFIGYQITMLLIKGDSQEIVSKIISILVGLVIGAALAWLIHKIFRPLMIGISSITGAFMSAPFLCLIFTDKINSTWFILAIILSVVGIIFQLKTSEKKLNEIFKLPSNVTNTNNNEDSNLKDKILEKDKIKNVQSRTLNILNQKLVLPIEYPNSQFYFLGGAILSILGFTKVYILIDKIEVLLFAVILTLIFSMYMKVNLNTMILNSVCAVFLIICAFGLISAVLKSGSIYPILYNSGMGLAVFSLWMGMLKKLKSDLWYTIATGILGAYFLLLAVSSSFNFISLGGIVALLPFVIPYVKKMMNNKAVTNKNDSDQEEKESFNEETSSKESPSEVEEEYVE